MKFTVKKVIIPPRFRQQLDLLAKFYILKQNQFISWILYLYLYIYIYTHTYMHKHIHTYIYIVFFNIVEVQILLHDYFVDCFVICLITIGKCVRVSLESFFLLSDVGYFPYFHLVLPFQYITEMPWTQSVSVLVYIKLFVETLKILNHRILHTHNKGRKPLLSVKSLYTNILSSRVMSKSKNVAWCPRCSSFISNCLEQIYLYEEENSTSSFIVQSSCMNLDVPWNSEVRADT